MAQTDGNLVLDDPYRGTERLDSVLTEAESSLRDTISSGDRILLIRLGGIGDAVRLLPTAAYLRNSGFNGALHCAVEPPVDQIMNCTNYMNHIHSIPLKDWKTNLTSILDRIDATRNTVFDWVFDCHGILKSGLLARLTRTRRRIGYHPSNGKEANSLFMNYTISALDEELPRLLKYLQLVRSFCSEKSLTKSLISPDFSRIQPVRSDVRKLADEHPVLVHPTSSAGRYGSKKDWGTQNMQSLIRRIREDTSRNILVTWGPGERSIAEEITAPFADQVHVAPETSPITNLLYLIQQSRLLVTIDSSPTHFADLLGTPVVVIFGVGKTRINAPFFTPYRMATREKGEEHTADIPVDRVYRAYKQLRTEIENSSSEGASTL